MGGRNLAFQEIRLEKPTPETLRRKLCGKGPCWDLCRWALGHGFWNSLALHVEVSFGGVSIQTQTKKKQKERQNNTLRQCGIIRGHFAKIKRIAVERQALLGRAVEDIGCLFKFEISSVGIVFALKDLTPTQLHTPLEVCAWGPMLCCLDATLPYDMNRQYCQKEPQQLLFMSLIFTNNSSQTSYTWVSQLRKEELSKDDVGWGSPFTWDWWTNLSACEARLLLIAHQRDFFWSLIQRYGLLPIPCGWQVWHTWFGRGKP